MYIYGCIRVAACCAMPCHAESKIRAKIIVLAVPSICVVPCQSCRASRAMLAVPRLLKHPNTSASVLRAVPCHISWPWGLKYGLVVQANGFTPFCPCVGHTRSCPAVPCGALPCHVVSPCRARRARPKHHARIIRAVPCLHLRRAVPAVSCSASRPFVP